MSFLCPPSCRAFLARHRRILRGAAGLAALCLAFFLLGRVATPVLSPGWCRVYF